MFTLRLFILILMPFMALTAAGQDSSHTLIDIRRVKLHEDIDRLQARICALDGKPDKMIVISKDIDLDLLLTDIYTRQTDALQLEIEKNVASDHRFRLRPPEWAQDNYGVDRAESLQLNSCIHASHEPCRA